MKLSQKEKVGNNQLTTTPTQKNQEISKGNNQVIQFVTFSSPSY